MPESRPRNLKPDAMPAFTMFCEAFCTKNQTTATIAAVAATCQRISRTFRSRRKLSSEGSLERRGEQQAALGPQLVLAALELQRRAHADRALVALAVVPDLLDDVVGPVVADPHHLAELALDAQQAADFGVGRLGLHLVDILGCNTQRLGRDLGVQHPAHDQLPALVTPDRK